MRPLAYALVAAVALAWAPAAGAVSAGADLAITSAPYVAWLPNGCTGTLVAPDRVLTAGHCLSGFSPNGFAVLIGKDGNTLIPHEGNPFDAVLANGGVRARGFAIKPGFREAFPFAHRAPQNAIALDDVGLILLEHPVTGIRPVALSTGGAVERPGGAASILGYGLTNATELRSRKPLQTGRMTILSAARCGRSYPGAIVASELCGEDLARRHADFVQACLGDSGGPFIRQTSAGPVQIGITSWGPEVKDAKCGRRRLPGVYMRVSRFGAFIRDPDPVIQPFPADPNGFVRVVGDARVGGRLTCVPQAYAGSPSTVSFKWIFDSKLISRRRSITARKAMAGRLVSCNLTVRNAGGSFDDAAPRVGRLRVAG